MYKGQETSRDPNRDLRSHDEPAILPMPIKLRSAGDDDDPKPPPTPPNGA